MMTLSLVRRATIAGVVLVTMTTAQAGTITMPTGTMLHVVLETTLSTKNSKVGDSFRARMVLPLFLNEHEVLPVGTAVQGTVAGVRAPGRATGRAELQLSPQKLYLPDGRDIEIVAALEGAKTDDAVKLDTKEGTVRAGGKDGPGLKKVASSVGMGAGVGAVSGGAMGAAIGAGAVGAIFVLHQIFKKGKDAVLTAGTELELEITRPFSFSDMQEVPPARNSASTEPEIAPGPVMQPARELDGQR